MKRSRFSPAVTLVILSLCIALASPAAVAAQGRQAPDPMWSTVFAGPLSGLGEIVGSAAQALRAVWSGSTLFPPPPPPPNQPNSDSGSCLDPDGRPMPCKPDF